MRKSFLTKAFVAAGVIVSAMVLSSMVTFAADGDAFTATATDLAGSATSGAKININTTIKGATISSSGGTFTYQDFGKFDGKSTDASGLYTISGTQYEHELNPGGGRTITIVPYANGNISFTYYIGGTKNVTVGTKSNNKSNDARKTVTTLTDECTAGQDFKITLESNVPVLEISFEPLSADAPVVTLNKTSLELNKNASETLTATPENFGDGVTITYASANSSIASVNETSGVVTGVAAGTTTITATATDGTTTKTATCSVTVTKFANVLNASAMSTGSLTTNTNVNNFLVCASSDYNVTVDGSSKTIAALTSKTTNRLKLNGAKESDYSRSIVFTTAGTTSDTGDLDVYAFQANSSNGYAVVLTDGTTDDTSYTPVGSSNPEVHSYSIKGGTTYTLYCSEGAMNIYYIGSELTLDTPVIPATKISDLYAGATNLTGTIDTTAVPDLSATAKYVYGNSKGYLVLKFSNLSSVSSDVKKIAYNNKPLKQLYKKVQFAVGDVIEADDGEALYAFKVSDGTDVSYSSIDGTITAVTE